MQAFVGPGEGLIIKEGERARGRGCDLRKRESSGAKMRRLRDGAGVLEYWSAGVLECELLWRRELARRSV